jgi:hypothetical protein
MQKPLVILSTPNMFFPGADWNMRRQPIYFVGASFCTGKEHQDCVQMPGPIIITT